MNIIYCKPSQIGNNDIHAIIQEKTYACDSQMMMGFKMFMLAAEEMNFSRAAEIAFVTQQCLSDHIKKLEDSYGVKFFTRRPRLSLTPEGEAMLRYISRLNVLGVDLKVIHDIPLLLGHEGSRTTFGVQENMQQ